MSITGRDGREEDIPIVARSCIVSRATWLVHLPVAHGIKCLHVPDTAAHLSRQCKSGHFTR